MPDHYKTLGVEPNATLQEIKTAYRQLARNSHPDKVEGRVEDFRAIDEAYKTLTDPEKRRIYDVEREREMQGTRAERRIFPDDYYARKEAVSQYKQMRLPYHIPSNPEAYNFYEYYNALFKLKGAACIKPGMSLNWEEIYAKLDYIRDRMWEEKNTINVFSKQPNQQDNERIRLLNKNFKQIEKYVALIVESRNDSTQKRRLYDIYIGHYQTEEDRDIAEKMGGAAAIERALRHNASMNFFASAVFLLHDMNLLTPDNFKKITASCWYHHRDCFRVWAANTIAETLAMLQPMGMADQTHLDFLVQHMSLPNWEIADSIYSGLNHLKEAGILTQKNLELVAKAELRGEFVGMVLRDLQEFGLWTPENETMAIQRIATEMPYDRLHVGSQRDVLKNHLLAMQEAGLLDEDVTQNLQWEPPDALKELCSHINQMFAYGLYLLSNNDAQNKGKEAMLLALQLKTDLRTFAEKPIAEQSVEKEAFKKKFIATLHSKDELMSEHRAHWKVVVTNILAMGIQYLRTGHTFFANTKCQQNIHKIEQSEWITKNQDSSPVPQGGVSC